LAEKITVIVVDDVAELRESLVSCLTVVGYSVSAVGNGEEFLETVATCDFDVAVIDVGLPEVSGLELATYVRKNTDMGVILLTALDTDADRLAGYESGCDIYMTKPAHLPSLSIAIKNLSHRRHQASIGTVLPPVGLWVLDQYRWNLYPPDGESISLTSLEHRCLKLLIQNACEPVTRDDLVEDLYPRNDTYSNRALDTLIGRLRAKVAGYYGSPLPVKTLYGTGYCFNEHALLR